MARATGRVIGHALDRRLHFDDRAFWLVLHATARVGVNEAWFFHGLLLAAMGCRVRVPARIIHAFYDFAVFGIDRMFAAGCRANSASGGGCVAHAAGCGGWWKWSV